MTFISLELPAEYIDKAQAEWLRARERRHRYEMRARRPDHNKNRPKFTDYQFVMWDGEAPVDTGYSLFGSSLGHEICHPYLETEECLNLILEAKKDNPWTIFFWFGGRYDFDEILRQSVPMRILSRLKHSGVIHWHGYRIAEIPGKIYRISKNGISVSIYEVSGWFHKRYVQALADYGIGTPEELAKMDEEKNRRSQFLWAEIAEIREYMRLELRLGPLLMDRIRAICHDAGFRPSAWYGPSALARELLRKNHVRRYMAECPEEVNNAACIAFAGGRFEEPRGGITGPNWTFDQNSAYMYAALRLPDLTDGTWRKGQDYESGKFALYHIVYSDSSRPFDPVKIQPLFRRDRNGHVYWPRKTDGWYWAPEAELVRDNPDARFTESWVFDENPGCARPFTFVKDIFARRLAFQRLPEGNPSREAHMALKWALAAIYGQEARAVGWDRRKRKPPPTHQIEWAGWILSACRAEMYKLAIRAGDKLISIDTDSVTALCDLDVDLGDRLGQWKKEYADAGVFFQNGVYFTQKNGEWSKGKTRGLERRKTPDLTPDMLMEAIRTGSAVTCKPKRKYVTVKMALNGMVDDAGKWIEHPGNVLVFGGGGKRYHNSRYCGTYCTGDVHAMLPSVSLLTANPFDIRSYPHKLPWKEAVPVRYDGMDILWVDTESIDDEEWLAELVSKGMVA